MTHTVVGQKECVYARHAASNANAVSVHGYVNVRTTRTASCPSVRPFGFQACAETLTQTIWAQAQRQSLLDTE